MSFSVIKDFLDSDVAAVFVQLYRIVIATRRQPFPFRTEGHAHDISSIKVKFECFLTIRGIVDSDSLIVDSSSGCQQHSVRAEDDTSDGSSMIVDRKLNLPGGHIPDVYFLVEATRCEPLTVRTECNTEHFAVISVLVKYHCAIRGVQILMAPSWYPQATLSPLGLNATQ